jgi:hypothetical protein
MSIEKPFKPTGPRGEPHLPKPPQVPPPKDPPPVSPPRDPKEYGFPPSLPKRRPKQR